MTVNVTTNSISYNGNGVTTSFAYPFEILQSDDLIVIVKSSAGIETTLTLNSNYTVTGAGSVNGGNVVLSSGGLCPTGAELHIIRSTDLLQETDYVDGQGFSAESLEDVVDKQMLVLQEYNTKFNRSLLFPKTGENIGNEIDGAEFANRASHILGFNSSGELALVSASSGITTIQTYALVSSYASLDAAVAAIGGANTTLLLDASTTILNNLTIPANITLMGNIGSLVTLTSGKTLTINGPFSAGDYQVFTGSGTVSGLKEARPEWWCITGTADDVAINKAIAACTSLSESSYFTMSNTPVVKLGPVIYNTVNPITVTKHNLEIRGEGTVINYSGAGNAFYFNDVNYPKFNGVQIVLSGNDSKAIHLRHTRYGRFKNIDLTIATGATGNTGISLISDTGDTGDCLYNKFSDIRLRSLETGIELNNVDTTSSRINSNRFENIILNTTDGVKITGSVGNYFSLDLEASRTPIALYSNAAGIKTTNNTFDIIWFETGNRTFNTVSDFGCDQNTFNLGYDFSSFNITGYNTIVHKGKGSMVDSDDSVWKTGYLGGIASRNFVPGSNNIGGSGWNNQQVTVTENNVIAPDNTTTGTKIVPITNTLSSYVSIAAFPPSPTTAIPNHWWTGSVYLRADVPHVATLIIKNDAGTQEGRSDVYVTTEWKRFSVSKYFTNGSSYVLMPIYPTYPGNTANTIYAWGEKIEQGFLTGYYTNITGETSTRFTGGLATNGDVLGARHYFNPIAVATNQPGSYKKRAIYYEDAKPEGGANEPGDMVINTAPAEAGAGGSKYVVLGWLRLTSGTGHTINVDWVEMRTLTGN